MPRGSKGMRYASTIERRLRIQELCREGKSDAEIAKIMGLHVRTVNNTTRFVPKPGDETE